MEKSAEELRVHEDQLEIVNRLTNQVRLKEIHFSNLKKSSEKQIKQLNETITSKDKEILRLHKALGMAKILTEKISKDKKAETEVLFYITHAVSGYSVEDIRPGSNLRTRPLPSLRHIVVYLTFQFIDNSPAAISRLLGYGDHAIVYHAISNVEKWIRYPKQYDKEHNYYTTIRDLYTDRMRSESSGLQEDGEQSLPD
jgi:chromosomal replication initiation ATPase DnaA